jgi:quinoprotein glucose dehydrogenase
MNKPEPTRSDMNYVAGGGRRSATGPRAERPVGGPRVRGADDENGPQGLPLLRPPWGRITAIDLNTGEHLWWVPNGNAADHIKNQPALQGVDLSRVGHPDQAMLMVTKTLLFAGVGGGMFNGGPGSGSPMFRVLNKATGELIHEMELPAGTTSIPMTYMVNGRQYIVVAVGSPEHDAELVALATP